MRICILFETLFACLFDFDKVYIFSAIRNSFVTVSFKVEFYLQFIQNGSNSWLIDIAMNFRMDLKIARELVFQHIFGWGNSVCPQWIANGICAVFGWVRVHVCVCLWVCMYVFVFAYVLVFESTVNRQLSLNVCAECWNQRKKENEVWTNRICSENSSIFFSRLHTKNNKTIHNNTNTRANCQRQTFYICCSACWVLFSLFGIFFSFNFDGVNATCFTSTP